MLNYNFPRLRSKEVIDSLLAEKVPEKHINENFLKRASEMSKKVIARPLVLIN